VQDAIRGPNRQLTFLQSAAPHFSLWRLYGKFGGSKRCLHRIADARFERFVAGRCGTKRVSGGQKLCCLNVFEFAESVGAFRATMLALSLPFMLINP
jgi:hypothetical protein